MPYLNLRHTALNWDTPQPQRRTEVGDHLSGSLRPQHMGGRQQLPARHSPAVSSLSFANTHDLISSPMALARGGGTALPTCDRGRVTLDAGSATSPVRGCRRRGVCRR